MVVYFWGEKGRPLYFGILVARLLSPRSPITQFELTLPVQGELWPGATRCYNSSNTMKSQITRTVTRTNTHTWSHIAHSGPFKRFCCTGIDWKQNADSCPGAESLFFQLTLIIHVPKCSWGFHLSHRDTVFEGLKFPTQTVVLPSWVQRVLKSSLRNQEAPSATDRQKPGLKPATQRLSVSWWRSESAPWRAQAWHYAKERFQNIP